MNDMTNPSAEESTRISVPLKPPVRTIDGHLEEVINIHKRLKAPDYVIIENLWSIIQHRMTGRSDYRYNPYLVFSRDIKKTGIDPDISVEKELYNKTFFELAKTTRPSDIINKLLFYGKTDDTSYETHVVMKAFMSEAKGSILIVNPTPDTIKYISSQDLNTITIAVPTDALAGLYGYEFKNVRFIPFHSIDIQVYDAILLLVRTEASNPNWSGFSALNCSSEDGLVMISIPEKAMKDIPHNQTASLQKDDDTDPITLRTRLNDNRLHIEKLLIVPADLTQSRPKGKCLLVCKKGAPDEHSVLLYKSSYKKNEGVLIIPSFSAMIKSDFLWIPKKSLSKEFNRQFLNAQAVQSKHYADKQYHSFSPEIKFRFSMYPGVENMRVRTSLLSHNTGKSISDELEKGLASSTPREACQKIELLPYRDEYRSQILMDLFTSVSLNSIRCYSLKTLWFIHRNPLQDIPGYDDMFCKDIIFCINRIHLPFIFPYKTSEFHVYSSAYKADMYGLSDKEEQKLWQQIWIILSYLSRRFNIINPIQTPQAESKQMPVGAQAGRNMITTRSFSNKQAQAIWKYIEEKDETGFLYMLDSLRILIAIRFMTGLPLSEILALEWGHMLVSSEYGTHLLYISGKMDKYGNRLNYSDFDPDRARIIAIPEQLFVILDSRRTYLKNHYPFASLDEVPIIIDSEPRSKNRKQFKRMSVESAANIFRKAKEKVSNGKRLIALESLGIETDYANYGGDLFNMNHEHYALKSGCNPGSLRYMYGFKPISTVELFYIDYENEAILNQTSETLARWFCSLKSMEKECSSTENLTVQGIYTDHIRLSDRTATIRLIIEASDLRNKDELYLTINSAHTVKVSIR